MLSQALLGLEHAVIAVWVKPVQQPSNSVEFDNTLHDGSSEQSPTVFSSQQCGGNSTLADVLEAVFYNHAATALLGARDASGVQTIVDAQLGQNPALMLVIQEVIR